MKNHLKQYLTGSLSLAFGLMGFNGLAANPIVDDNNPPSWRGVVGSTVQKWTFDVTNTTWQASPAGWVPDSVTNPNGTPRMQMSKVNANNKWVVYSAGWATSASISNVWYVSSSGGTAYMTNMIPMPSSLPVGAFNYVVLQVTHCFLSGSIPVPTMLVPGAVAVDSSSVQTATGNGGVVWNDYKTTWRVPSTVTVFTNIMSPSVGAIELDAVIADTVTINPSHTNMTVDSGTVTYGAPIGVPAALFSSYTCVPPETYAYPGGSVSNVVCSVSDTYGGSAPYTFTVTVRSAGVPPTVTACSGGSVALSDNCSVLMPDLTGGVTWTAGTPPVASLVQTPAAGTVLKAGVYVVAFTATNSIGGAACTTTYTVSGASPVAPPMALGAVADTAQKLDIAKLGIHAGADGRSASFFDVFLATAAGGTAVSNNNQIVYTPALHYLGADSMTYRVVDCGGVWATNTISITVGHAAQSLNMIGVSDNASGGKLIKARGIPTITYHLQQTDSLQDVPSWTTVTDQVTGGTADSQGIIYFTNKAASASSGYYRTTYP